MGIKEQITKCAILIVNRSTQVILFLQENILLAVKYMLGITDTS